MPRAAALPVSERLGCRQLPPFALLIPQAWMVPPYFYPLYGSYPIMHATGGRLRLDRPQLGFPPRLLEATYAGQCCCLRGKHATQTHPSISLERSPKGQTIDLHRVGTSRRPRLGSDRPIQPASDHLSACSLLRGVHSPAMWFEPPTGERSAGAECDKLADR